ncbi:transmembrane protein, putative (macronuclear) [Tetrahymena thermophila SB210]|uniref:Transmembrane protein, putative n=1 Tax=Tetrahymena thermophila (strain SB210) TaxID=312017 RepID=Q23AR8_TETTS|nr:transmembrane protein, putative [Tetrahymena thermophila SB210]EAR93624.2 transmembrane protein, putative [Tetrahymena thermophila SB210]|eukprot:XP_001013869.2 transmembrane protein, putative [Tetrahymena thermophila SB210]
MKKQFREYLSTILEIMEDKPSFLIPKIIYYAIVIIYFNQIAGYLFSTQEKKALKEEKAKFIGRVNELSTGTYLLYYKGEDLLTLLFFGIFQLSMYFYYIYVGVYTYLRKKKQLWFSKNKRIFQIVNQYLNIFFTFYWWIFFSPYLEINITMLSCNNYSFLKIMRNKNCSNVSPVIFVLGYIGFFFSIATATVAIFLFRNNEFGSKDYLRRKFNFIQILVLVCRASVIFLYYLNLNKILLFKEILMCFLILLMIVDIYLYKPYYNQDIMKMYSCCVAAFTVGIITIIILNETDYIYDTDVFYYFVLYLVILSSAFIVFLNFSYEKIIRINSTNFKEHYKKIDQYLEEIFNLLENNKKSEEAQFRLFEVLIYHKQFCQNYNCQCQQTSFKNTENSIIKEDVLKFIESMFLFSLKQKQVRENQDLFEHLSLKYISFIAKYRNNPVKAYYELKYLMSQHTNQISFYFDCIQNIFSARIEEMILLHQQNKLKELKDQTQVYSTRIDEDITKLELSDFIYSDKIKTKILPLISQFVDLKANLYEQMRAGFEKISLFGDKITRMSNIATNVTIKLKTYLGSNISFSYQTSQGKRTSQNVYILKILSIYEGIVLNRIQESTKYEELILELKKRDYLLNQAVLNTLNILKGNILSVIVSYSKERGKIISLNSKRINNFFGYSQNTDLNLQYIDQFMPQFLQQIHNSLMQNYIRRSYSPLIKQSHFSYALNSEGFIFPISISVENIFEYRDDFCLYGSILKLENAKELFVINIKGQILGLTQLIYEDVFKTAEQNKSFKQKKINIDAFDVMQKISFYMILPEVSDIILKHQQQISEEEGLEKFDLNSSIETIAQNQQGVIKIPESIFELQNQFKANQYFISEKSKGLSQTSLQTSIFQHQDTEEIIELYQNFYKENLIEWSKESLASETKIKYNIIKQSLKHMQDKKKITEEFYIIQINESSRITSEIDRKDSLEINSPKKQRKRKGDALSPHKAFTNRRISFYDVFKLATQQQSNQRLMINQVNTPSNSTLQGTPYMRKRKLQTEQENDHFNQSSTSLDKHLSQNLNLSPEINNKIGERKSRYLSSFSHLSDKNHVISQQNIYGVEKSLINLNNETYMTSNQNIELSSKIENNKLQISKITNNIHNSSHSYEVLSPLKRLLGPQFSKDNKPIVKTASKDFEPKFSIDESERPDEEKIKIKNLFLHQNSLASSSLTAKSPSPKPKLSLWQRIKNKVSTTNTQSNLQRGIALFLKERQEAFNEEKQDKIFQNPETISSNIAMDMEYEEDVVDVDQSSITKKGTTTVRKNGKSTQEPKTNNQIRSFSHISSQSSKSYGVYLFQSIAYSFHLPSIFYKLKIFFVFFIIIFISLQIALSLGIITQYSKLKDDLTFNQIALIDDTSVQIQILNSINLYAIQIGLISGQYSTSVQNQITNISNNYGQIFPRILQQYLNFQFSQNSLYDVGIFSFNNQQMERKSLAELKYYNLNSVTQVLQLGKNSNKLQNDQFFYLSKNSIINQNLDKSLLSNSFSNFRDLSNTLDWRVDFFIGSYIIVFFFFIICFFPFLRQINSYQERVLILIARMTESECLQESTKLSDVLKYIQSKNEQWVYKNFMISDQQTLNEALKKSIKSSNFLKTQRQPISSKIKNQKIKNYRQICYFIIISLLGFVYFSIFTVIIKQYSNQSDKYLHFFEFSQQTLPSFNSMLIDWSLLINFPLFKSQNQYFPNLDIAQLNQDYQLSFKNVSNFLTQFQQELNELSSITNSNNEAMNQLYTKSLCQYYSKQQLCNQVSEYTQKIYDKGLASLISNYLQFLNNNEFLLGNIPFYQQQQVLTQYYSTTLFTELVLMNYLNTTNFIQEIVNISISDYNNFYSDFQKTHLLYFLIFGIFMVFLFIIMAFSMYKINIMRLMNINFGLTCFPNSKIQEESTLQMLKFIKKI